MKENITPNTCRSCGACCIVFTNQKSFCDVTKEDEERLGKRFVRLHVLRPRTIDALAAIIDGARIPRGAIRTRWRETRAGMLRGTSVNACVALKGDVMNKTSCGVYDKRPTACRTAVVPGDKSCRWIRQSIRQAMEKKE